MIGQIVDIEEDRTGNVILKILRTSINNRRYSHRWKRRVENNEVAIVKPLGEPRGSDERIHEISLQKKSVLSRSRRS